MVFSHSKGPGAGRSSQNPTAQGSQVPRKGSQASSFSGDAFSMGKGVKWTFQFTFADIPVEIFRDLAVKKSFWAAYSLTGAAGGQACLLLRRVIQTISCNAISAAHLMRVRWRFRRTLLATGLLGFLFLGAWEPLPGTSLGNLFLGTLLGNLFLGNSLGSSSCERYLGTTSREPCLATCSWEPCLGTCSWELSGASFHSTSQESFVTLRMGCSPEREVTP